MATFEEIKVQSGAFRQIDLSKDLMKNQSMYFYIGSVQQKTSQSYGDFLVLEGVELDAASNTAEDMINKGDGASFVANTLIKNLLETGSITEGKTYRIVKKWSRGDEFENGKQAKGHGYEFYEQKLSLDQTTKLHNIYTKTKSGEIRADNTSPKETL